MNRKWKAYFYIIAIQAIGAPTATFLSGATFDMFEIINILFIITGIIGLFNYVYTKTIGSLKFWKLFLPTFVLWDIFFICFLLPNQTPAGYDGKTWAITLILFAFLFPQYLGIYRYGYNNHSEILQKT